MKIYVYLFVFLLSSCFNTNTGKRVAVKRLSDTAFESKRIEFYMEYEDSASAYSYIFYEYGKQMLGMSISCDLDEKEADKKTVVLFADTTAVSKSSELERMKNKRTDYKKFLYEFACCMEKANSIYDLSTLKQILFRLTCFQDKSYEVAKNIINDNNANNPTYSDIEHAIYNTSLKNDFNDVLKPYGLKVSEILCGDSPIMLFRRNDLTDFGKRNYNREFGLSVQVRIRLSKTKCKVCK